MAGLTTGFELTAQQAKMLDELKGYLDQNFPADHESHTMPEWGPIEEFHWARDFNRKLFDDGWLCPHWPEEYGGRGLTPLDQMLIREEFAYRRVPMCNANGLDMLSPILLKYGSDEQKDERLVKIARMEEMWCQGYSEPDGGSDLTHLKTTAIRDGEEYVVNGSKIWTGHAMHAHWMILLCRTDPEQKGSKGLSLLMVDLRDAPGIQIYPIRSMTGEVTFCQEYFMDARVPAENLVGPERRGVGGGRHPAGARALGGGWHGPDAPGARRPPGHGGRAGRRARRHRREAGPAGGAGRDRPHHGLQHGRLPEPGRGLPAAHAVGRSKSAEAGWAGAWANWRPSCSASESPTAAWTRRTSGAGTCTRSHPASQADPTRSSTTSSAPGTSASPADV